MKKSRSITLTAIASMGLAASAQQPAPAPSPPVAAQGCKERRKAAKAAGVPFTESCGHGGSAGHTTTRGGFGATGKGHSGGG